MVRVTDILSELNRQLGPLERQSQAARIYLGKRDELRTLDVNLFLLESTHMAGQLSELNEKHEPEGTSRSVRGPGASTERDQERNMTVSSRSWTS